MNLWVVLGVVLALTLPVGAADEEPAPAKPAETGSVLVTATITNVPAPAKEPMVVTSDRLQVDYAHNMGTFQGNVLVIDPQIAVRADKMVVFFGISTNGNRTLHKILADGGVVINQGERKSTSEHAVYTAEDGKAVLTGKPQLQSPEGTLTGKTITFWRSLQKVDVESDTRLVIFPDELKKDKPVEQPVAPPK